MCWFCLPRHIAKPRWAGLPSIVGSSCSAQRAALPNAGRSETGRSCHCYQAALLEFREVSADRVAIDVDGSRRVPVTEKNVPVVPPVEPPLQFDVERPWSRLQSGPRQLCGIRRKTCGRGV
jgi:hypothetical protein